MKTFEYGSALVRHVQIGIVAVALCALSANAQTPDPAALESDASVVENLLKAGSDLKKKRDVDFFFVFINQQRAKDFAKELTERGFSVRSIARRTDNLSWEVHAQKVLAPELKTMQELTVVLTALADKYIGYYDGWGTVAE